MVKKDSESIKDSGFDWDKWGKAWDKSWRRKKNESTVWLGIFILLLGVLWYSFTIGLIDLNMVCPGALIIIGAMFILKGLLDQIFNM
jgi:predicted nucleic acid-binding Zn ribbon protein